MGDELADGIGFFKAATGNVLRTWWPIWFVFVLFRNGRWETCPSIEASYVATLDLMTLFVLNEQKARDCSCER